MTVAIVDAYDDPAAESDLQTYRNYFNLPACTTANGCFRKVDQRGGTNYPAFNKGWAGEIALDIDMVSAICPNCHILLVEADTSSTADLAAGVDEAASLGVNAISNSYGGPEISDEASEDVHYNHPGIAITASSGDNGYSDTEVPALLPHVTAAGGTRLVKDGSSARGWTERVWGSGFTSNSKGGTGSGCSAYIPKPVWQTDLGCDHRTEGDVAVDADPNTGVAIFDSNERGWGQFGGTSVSAPVIAAIYALAGNTFLVNDASLLYSPTASLYDVTSGSNGYYNGHSCIVDSTNSSVSEASSGTNINQSVGSSGAKRHHKGHHRKRHHKGHHHSRAASLSSALLSEAYLCNGEPGYDAPTGNGTPNGTGAF
jgi:subtilase family serine protease